MEKQTVSGIRRSLGNFLSFILPNDDAVFRGEYDHSHLSEYNGPAYDDPEQLAKVRHLLGLPVVEQVVEKGTC